MKQWLFLFTCLCSLNFALPIQDHTVDPEALSKLCSALGIPEGADLIAETQRRWLRGAGQERWELAELTFEKKVFVLDWAERQGLFAPWEPTCERYQTALILGATTSYMQKRLDTLKDLWIQGIRFEQIVWLTGERPLDPRIDGLTDRCANESEAARILWQETPLPNEMRDLPVTFIDVPMKGEAPFLKRPNTEDTIIAWLKTNPEPGTALFVSDQPFCGYQFAIIKTCLPVSFAFDVVGKGVDSISHPAAAAITLDTIARWIYQENIYQSKINGKYPPD